jgi:acyl carrier protein
MQEIKDRLVAIMTEQFGVSIAEAAADGGEIFANHGRGWAAGALDSLDKVEFAMAVEDEFDVEIPDDRVKDFRTLDDVATFVGAAAHGPR